MGEPFTSKRWAVWIQPGGPNTTNYYLGCHTLDDVVENGGGVKDLVHVFRPDGPGWDVLTETRDRPGLVTTALTGLMEPVASWLEKIVEGGRCPFPLYVNGKPCPPYDTWTGADRTLTLERAAIGTVTRSGLAHRDEDNVSEQAFEISGRPPLVNVRAIRTDRIPFTGTELLFDIASCSRPRCASDCQDAVAACDVLVAVADSDPASADVWISFDHGVTWTATATDPYVGPTTDLRSVVCFPMDTETTRILVAREAVVGTRARVYYSDDWGATWTSVELTTSPISSGATQGGALFALDMAHVWVVVNNGADSEIWFSDDGGTSWTELEAITGHVLYAIWFSDEYTGMCVGTTDDVYTTTDGGVTWAAATATGGGDTNYHVTENAGGGIWWIGTNAGELWYSDDLGVTWAMRAFPGSSVGTVFCLDFVTPTVGFMVHSPSNILGRLFRTRDGGFTWELESDAFAARLWSVIGCTPNEAFAVGAVDTTALVVKAHD